MKIKDINTKFSVAVFCFAFNALFSFAQSLPVISEKFEQASVYTRGDSLIGNTNIIVYILTIKSLCKL